jgi:undecaprenyl-diphosphatase
MQPAEHDVPLSHAIALGLLQGPVELLPISSSAHTTLLPWLAGWPYASLDGEVRKSFELALHAGAGLALATARGRLYGPRRVPSSALLAAISLPALAGLTLRGAIERRLGGPRSIAAGLTTGAAAMALAGRGDGDGRGVEQAGARDGLALGLAQAAALAPGVSRNGATLATARARGFESRAAHSLSWQVGLPLVLGASAAECARAVSGAVRVRPRTLAVGGAASFASTALGLRLLGPRLQRAPLAAFAAYRVALSALVLLRLRRSQ